MGVAPRGTGPAISLAGSVPTSPNIPARPPSPPTGRPGVDTLTGRGAQSVPMDADPDALADAWRRAQERLPVGWRLDGLRCGSTGLTPEQRSDDWLAGATGPDGAQRTFHAADPFDALVGLVAMLEASIEADLSAVDQWMRERHLHGRLTR